MAIKKFTVAILLITAMASTFSTCKKSGILGCNENFNFTVNAKVYPDLDTVRISDTIFIETSFPVTLIDSSSGQVAHLSGGLSIGTDMGFTKLVSTSPIVLEDAVADFDFILINGKELISSMPQKVKSYSFLESGGQFHFKLAIIPKDIGTFRFGLAPAPRVEEKNSTCPTFTLNYLLKNTTDQHYYLYPGGSGVTPTGADYYFYVR